MADVMKSRGPGARARSCAPAAGPRPGLPAGWGWGGAQAITCCALVFLLRAGVSSPPPQTGQGRGLGSGSRRWKQREQWPADPEDIMSNQEMVNTAEWHRGWEYNREDTCRRNFSPGSASLGWTQRMWGQGVNQDLEGSSQGAFEVVESLMSEGLDVLIPDD